MKYKLSISVDENTVFLIQDMMRTRKFKNKSHVVENAVLKFYKEEVPMKTHGNY